MHQISVGELKIDVVRKDIKNLHLAVYPPHGRIRIATPLRIDDEAVRLFAISKLSWIKKQQEKFRHQDRQSERQYISGETHYFKGRKYRLNVIQEPGTPRIEIRNKNFIDLYIRPESTPEQREKVITEWYRDYLKKEIPTQIIKWQKITGLEVKEWGIKQMRTKWGTCNPEAKRIWLNLELAKKPPHCLEYIIVHEIVHFLERHHNDRFIAYMDQFLPTWRAYKEELNRFTLGFTKWEY
ncbi:MAG: SprT family zinc-dependent metalloprotease [Bacteroidetes bacterium]|nr:SprT family zinc-dependent metalloprotease [Bacteroidota bacterium]